MIFVLVAMIVGLFALIALARRTGHGWGGTALALAPFALAVAALVWRSTYVEGPDLVGVFAFLPSGLIAGFVILAFKPWPDRP